MEHICTYVHQYFPSIRRGWSLHFNNRNMDGFRCTYAFVRESRGSLILGYYAPYMSKINRGFRSMVSARSLVSSFEIFNQFSPPLVNSRRSFQILKINFILVIIEKIIIIIILLANDLKQHRPNFRIR